MTLDDEHGTSETREMGYKMAAMCTRCALNSRAVFLPDPEKRPNTYE